MKTTLLVLAALLQTSICSQITLATGIRLETWSECKEGDSYPTDQTDYNHPHFSTRVGFLVYYVLDSEGMHVNGIPLDELKMNIVKEQVESTSPTRTYVKRELGFDRIIHSYYRDGEFHRDPLSPPQPLMNPRLFSCVDYSF